MNDTPAPAPAQPPTPPPPARAFVFPGPPLPVQASASVAKPATARPPGGCLLIAIEFIGYLAAGATGLTVLIAHELLTAMLAAITTLLALILIAVCHVGYHLLRTR